MKKPTKPQRAVLEKMRDGQARYVTDFSRPFPTVSWQACVKAGWLLPVAPFPNYVLSALGRSVLENSDAR